MSAKNRSMAVLRGARLGLATIALMQFSLFGPLAGNAQAHDHDHDGNTRTPIKHVIVIVGENRSFDHIFATYKPKDGESVSNLLSEQIVKEDGTPGKNFWKAYQYSADVTGSTTFQLSPTTKKSLYSFLPAPLNGGPTDVCKDNGICTLGDATSSENGLATDYYQFMLTGGTGLTGKVPDTRITGVHGSAPYSTLPPGPFQLTNSRPQTRSLMMPTPPVRCTVSIRCGSNWIATQSMGQREIPMGASRTISPGRK